MHSVLLIKRLRKYETRTILATRDVIYDSDNEACQIKLVKQNNVLLTELRG